MVTKTSEIIEDPNELKTVDFEIEELARSKNNLILSFLDAIKEVAIDCELFKNHNMIGTKYRCFKFNEVSLFDKNIGPAYKDDILEDIKISNGSNSTKSITVRVKVIKISGIIDNAGSDNKKEEPQNYWYNPDTESIGYGVIYDYDLNYPIGKVKFDSIGNPEKLDKDTYKIELIPIPTIKHSR